MRAAQRLTSLALPFRPSTTRKPDLASTKRSFTSLPVLPSADLQTFKSQAFTPSQPVLLPRGHYETYPALTRWFTPSGTLNTTYLLPHSQTTHVPLERRDVAGKFSRTTAPLAAFLTDQTGYIAQCPISSLPPLLQADLPTPELVLKAGKGDIYDSSIWLGTAPTYTPLHRDPNPNLFIQLAGRKVLRIFQPEVGSEIYALEMGTGRAGEFVQHEAELMNAARLEEAVWKSERYAKWGLEGSVGRGDAVFVPKGWWHSVKSEGTGMVGSVNWWFR